MDAVIVRISVGLRLSYFEVRYCLNVLGAQMRGKVGLWAVLRAVSLQQDKTGPLDGAHCDTICGCIHA